MTLYDNSPNLWSPPVRRSLFVVKVPAETEFLTEKLYKSLIQQRLDWMIQRWMMEFPSTQEQTQMLLLEHLQALSLYQDYPALTGDSEEDETTRLRDWRQAWAETLILYSDRFNQLLTLNNVNFPAIPLNKTHPDFQRLLEIHQATHLEEWLLDLTP